MRGATVLALENEAEWIIVGSRLLGVPKDEATNTASVFLNCPLGMVPAGIVQMVVRVCPACVAKAKPPLPRPGSGRRRVPPSAASNNF